MSFVDQPQYLVTLSDDLVAGTELLVSFWSGPHQPPEVAPRSATETAWGAPLLVGKVHS